MTRFRATALGAAAILAAAAVALAQTPSATPGHEGHAGHGSAAPARETPQKGVRMTIVGEVIDPACYIEAGAKSAGPGHFQCAVDCAKSGQTLAILDRVNDRIYFLAGEYPGQNPNDPVMQFIHKKVDVTGFVYNRSGAWGIVIVSVALHKDSPGAPAKPAAGTGAPPAGTAGSK
jgi:hypothetical protein